MGCPHHHSEPTSHTLTQTSILPLPKAEGQDLTNRQGSLFPKQDTWPGNGPIPSRQTPTQLEKTPPTNSCTIQHQRQPCCEPGAELGHLPCPIQPHVFQDLLQLAGLSTPPQFAEGSTAPATTTEQALGRRKPLFLGTSSETKGRWKMALMSGTDQGTLW